MRVHLVDGTYELFRAHHSPRPRRSDPAGREVTGTVGMVASLLRAVDEEDITHVAVAFDNPIESFRNDLFAGYKDSSGVDPELLAQFDRVEEAMAALGVVVWSMQEWEADDAMATAALRLGEGTDDDVEQVRLLTPDKDLGQVVRGRRIVQVDRMRDRVFDEDGVRDRLGVPPLSVPDYLALVGDGADGIPGIRGFGAKTAAALLGRYVHLEAIPDDGSSWEVEVRGAEGLGRRLAEQREEAMLYRRLATLVTDVPLSEDLSDLAWSGVRENDFTAWCEDIGAQDLADRPPRRH